MLKNLVINSNELLELCKSKGIRVTDMSWNSLERKFGYSKTSPAGGGFVKRFYYFEINKDSIITDCPRGFSKLRGKKISDLDNLTQLVNS